LLDVNLKIIERKPNKSGLNVLKFYQQLTGGERRIPFIFDDFDFCRSSVIGLDYDGK
jgi:hypothetical protein